MNGLWARRAWEHKDLWGLILWLLFLPFSFIYGFGMQIRNLLYFLGWLPSKSLSCMVISVGNLTVGGTGKTPTTLWLARELEKRGHRVATLSRGYRRTGRGSMILEPGFKRSLVAGEDVFEAGDEPMMMARIFAQKVGVGSDRYEVGEQMLRGQSLDVLILDDGFQHRRLRRDVDILLLGSQWNGPLLPAGPFREPRTALRRADFYLVTAARECWQRSLKGVSPRVVFFGSLQATALLGLEGEQWKEYPLSVLDRSKILAVSGLANPSLFYRMIHDWEGEIVDTMEFPDHHPYSTKDWQGINRAARNVDLIVTTEKDLLKLVRFPFPREKLLALRVEMVVENGGFLLESIEAAIQAKKGEA